MEKWKTIKGFKGKYMVSSLGRVKSLERTITYTTKDGQTKTRTVKEKLISPGGGVSNYQICVLCKGNGEKKAFLVHRLVAEAFLPNPNNYGEVNHKDKNKANNSVDNLEWCDRSYNQKYSGPYWGLTENEIDEIKKEKQRSHYKRTTDNSVVVYENDKKIGIFKNYAKAAIFMGVSAATVSNRIKSNDTTPISHKYIIKKAS